MRDLRALPTGNGALKLVRNSMKLKVSLTLSAVALLAACGGGGSTSNIPMVDENPMDGNNPPPGNNPGASYTPLGDEDDIFGDGAGVARGTANDGSQALISVCQKTPLKFSDAEISAIMMYGDTYILCCF